jgi:hypothetical protein
MAGSRGYLLGMAGPSTSAYCASSKGHSSTDLEVEDEGRDLLTEAQEVNGVEQSRLKLLVKIDLSAAGMSAFRFRYVEIVEIWQTHDSSDLDSPVIYTSAMICTANCSRTESRT